MVGPAIPEALRARTGGTLLELFDRAVARTPDDVVFVMPRGLAIERWTYGQLEERTGLVARLLAANGVTHGSRVVTWSPNDPWLVAAYFATWSLGGVVVPLDLRMSSGVVERIGQQVGPTLTIAGPGLERSAAELLPGPILALPFDLSGLDGAEPPALLPSTVVRSTDPCQILYTSGTTADPKGVEMTHGQLVHNGLAIAQRVGMRRERALSLLPLSHLYGQIVPLLHGLISNSQVTFLPTLTPNSLSAALVRDRITAITAVPQILRLLLDRVEAEADRRGRRERLDRARRIAARLPMGTRRILFRSALARFGGALETISCGGARLDPALQAAWEAMGIRIIQGYGATECAAITGHSRTSRRPGSVGEVMGGVEIAFGDSGEILVRGPGVMTGYWARPDETAAVLIDGWLQTGDAGTLDEHGELRLLGRTRDRIALPNGLKVYPEDVEAELVKSADVRAAVVFEAAPGRLAAVLVPSDPATDDGTLNGAVDAANARLGQHQRVRDWVRWPEPDFPRTHTLKIRRREVQAWLDAHVAGGRTVDPEASSAPATVAPASSPVAALVELVAAQLRADGRQLPVDLGPDTVPAQLELDSLSTVALAMRIEGEFGASLEEPEIAEAPNLAALSALIAERRGAPPPPPPSRLAFGLPAVQLRRATDALITGPVIRLIGRPVIEGLERLDGLTGPALVCGNHTSHLDAPSVRIALPERIRRRTAIAAAADYFFEEGMLGPVVAVGLGAFPFGRSEHVRSSLERIGELVAEGWTIVIFPEGTRSPSGRMAPLKSGIGLLATQLGVPVVPVGIRGAHAILPKGARLPGRRARLRISFGTPLTFDATTPVAEATAAIEAAIRGLSGN
jgi:long-chain acyl-CoA synthetase